MQTRKRVVRCPHCKSLTALGRIGDDGRPCRLGGATLCGECLCIGFPGGESGVATLTGDDLSPKEVATIARLRRRLGLHCATN